MTLESLARAIGVTPKWIQNTERTLGRRFPRSADAARELLAIHLLQHDGGLTLPAAATVAGRFVRGEPMPESTVVVSLDAARLDSRLAAGLAAVGPENQPRRGRPRALPGRTARQRLEAYGDDPTLLESALARRPAERLAVVEEFSAFTYEAQAPLRRVVRGRSWPVPLRLRDLLTAIADARLDVVIVGGVAGNVAGSSRVTTDLDLCYAPSPENCAALAAMLVGWGAQLRGAPSGLPFILDARTLCDSPLLTLRTSLGDVDVMDRVAGVGAWPDVHKASEALDVFGVRLRVLTLEALIAARKAARRRKDLDQLPELEALLEMRRSRRRSR
jgi:hypothetical protein